MYRFDLENIRINKAVSGREQDATNGRMNEGTSREKKNEQLIEIVENALVGHDFRFLLLLFSMVIQCKHRVEL